MSLPEEAATLQAETKSAAPPPSAAAISASASTSSAPSGSNAPSASPQTKSSPSADKEMPAPPPPAPVTSEAEGPFDPGASEPASKKPKRKRIVVVGAGLGGLLVAQTLSKRRELEVILVSASDSFVFLPRLTELFRKSVPRTKVVLPLRDVWKRELVIERATLVNPEEKTVVLESGRSVVYDVLVLAAGSETNFFNTPGAAYAFPFYGLGDVERLENHLENMLAADEGTGAHTFTIVGAGPTGTEVANVLIELVRAKRPKARVLLLDRLPKILQVIPELQSDVEKVLTRKGVEIMTGVSVAGITPLSVEIAHAETKETIPCYTTIWAAGSKPVALAITGVTRTERGELPVTKTLQLIDHPMIFALGDMAGTGSPKTAQAAAQEAATVADNVLRVLAGKPAEPFAFNYRGTIIALENDTVGLFFGRKLSGFIARTMRDTYYTFSLSQYK